MHKKYIRIGGKTYGPYYYQSYRDNGKVRKRYLKVSNDSGRRVKTSLKLFVLFYLAVIVLLIFFTIARYFVPFSSIQKSGRELLLAPPGASSGFSDDANLSIWDDTDLGENRFSGIQVNFYANYTDLSGNVIDNSIGECNIRYDFTGSYTSYELMNYDSASLMWKSNRNFNYKGTHSFEVRCTSEMGNVTLNNNFVITNTEPNIFETPAGYLDFDGNSLNNDVLQCLEDVS